MYTRFTALLLLLAGCLAAVGVSINDNPLSVRVLQDDPLRIRLEFGSFTYDEVEIDGDTWALPYLDHESMIMEKGMPQLPQVVRSIAIPGDRKPQLTVVDQQSTTMQLRVAPSKGHMLRTVDPATVPYEFGDFYNGKAIEEQPLAVLGDPYILRDYRGVTVQFKPFSYDPISSTLTVTTSIEVEVSFDQVATVNPKAVTNELKNRAFGEIYSNHFINLDNPRYVPVEEQGRMIIICYDDFLDEMAPFVQWKRQKGIETTLYSVDTIGNNDADIADFIQDQYDLNDGLTWVLLVGDAYQVDYPSYGGYGADPIYALVDGDDSYPDIFVGRLSAQTAAHVETQVERLVEYERDISSGDWLSKGTGIASSQGDGSGDDGEADWVHMNNIRNDLLGYHYSMVDQLYATTGATDAMVSSALNEGRSIINYCGHGSTTSWGTTAFNYADINNLTNDNMLPFIFSVACLNGNFVNYTCFAEYWMRATNNTTGEPTGAIGIYASSNNQEWAPPMAAQDEMIDLIIADEKVTFGGICYNGSCLMIDEYSYYGPRTYKTWNIFGDPSLQVRTQAPTSMNISHAQNIPLGTGTLSVATNTSGAICSLTRDGSILAVSETDAVGNAILSFEPVMLPSQVLLTVTAPNRTTYQASILAGELQGVTGLTIEVIDGMVHLSWDNIPSASSYNVYTVDLPSGSYMLRGSASQPEWTASSAGAHRFYYITAVYE